MKAVIGDMTISNGGVLRLNKSLVESLGVKPGDRLIIMRDTGSSKITIQLQRGNEVILRLSDCEIVRPQKGWRETDLFNRKGEIGPAEWNSRNVVQVVVMTIISCSFSENQCHFCSITRAYEPPHPKKLCTRWSRTRTYTRGSSISVANCFSAQSRVHTGTRRVRLLIWWSKIFSVRYWLSIWSLLSHFFDLILPYFWPNYLVSILFQIENIIYWRCFDSSCLIERTLWACCQRHDSIGFEAKNTKIDTQVRYIQWSLWPQKRKNQCYANEKPLQPSEIWLLRAEEG